MILYSDSDQEESEKIDLSDCKSETKTLDYQQNADEGQEYVADDYKEYIYQGIADVPVRQRQSPTANFFAPNYYHNAYYLANDELPPHRSSLLFPASRQIYQYVQDKQKLNELMQLQLKRNKLFLDVRLHQTKNKYIRDIIVVCHSCGSKLLMKYSINRSRNETHFKLVHFDNTHIHQSERCVVSNKEFKHRLFQKEMEQMDKNSSWTDFFKMLQKKYNITKRDFKHFQYALKEKRDHEMKALLKQFKELQARVWMCNHFSIYQLLALKQFQFTEDYSKDPDFMMWTLKFMEENCKKFSRICSISVVSGFVANSNKFGVKSWQIITFSGLNHFNYLVPYCFAFLESKQGTIESIINIFNKFINIFSVKPEIIMTPYEPFYTELINKLRTEFEFSGLHIYDGLCYIETIGEQLDNIHDRIYYQNIILSRSKYEFRQNCRILQQKVQPTQKNMDIFNKLVEIAPKMCFAMIDTHEFIGLIFRYSANKYVLNLFKQLFTRRTILRYYYADRADNVVKKKWRNAQPTLIKSCNLILRAIIKHDKDINERAPLVGGYCQWRHEKYIDLPEIQNIRVNIKKVYLDMVMEEYGKIFEMEATERDLKDPSLPEMKTFDVYDKKSKSIFVVSPAPIFTATRQFSKCVWLCNCGYSLKSGLPCAHQVKVAVFTHTSIMEQIHQLWLKKRVYVEGLKRRGRTKGSRRNKQK